MLTNYKALGRVLVLLYAFIVTPIAKPCATVFNIPLPVIDKQ